MKNVALISLLAASVALPVFADEKHHKPEAASARAAQASAMNEGEVRRVDKDAKKITIKHGPLEKLDMPAMTMVFQVEDPAMLERVKAGDKVRFEADKVKGAYVIKRLEPAN